MVAKTGFNMSAKFSAHYLYIGILVLITSLPCPALATERMNTLTIQAPDQSEITVERYPANGKYLYIWQPHEAGLQAIDRQFAQRLAAKGIEVWLTDLLEAWFLPNTASNMEHLPADAFASLIQVASKQNKRIIIGASGRAAVPALRGLRKWQLDNPGTTEPAGVVLLSPKLFVKTPEPGLSGTLLPITQATNIPVVLLQPDKSPWFWKLEQTVGALQKNGSEVFLWPVRNVRDRFYFRPDATESETKTANQFHQQLHASIQLLAGMKAVSRQGVKMADRTPRASDKKQERILEVYKGNPQPPPLILPGLDNTQFNLELLKGQVVLVNFWATWCPPCVHEMPSMQRLSDHFRNKPFTIIGVNMAEDKKDINRFLNTKVHVSFPIIMDRDGTALKNWKVFAFPTSYVLDKKGKIRFALFGGVEWDTPDTINKINQLLDE